jgi:hypothetical protein
MCKPYAKYYEMVSFKVLAYVSISRNTRLGANGFRPLIKILSVIRSTIIYPARDFVDLILCKRPVFWHCAIKGKLFNPGSILPNIIEDP